MAALLATASRPRQLAAGGDAPASRDIVVPGESGTPLSRLTETTDSQQRKSGGAWYADPQRDSAVPWAACRARPSRWRQPRDSFVVFVQGGNSALHAGWHYNASGEVKQWCWLPCHGRRAPSCGQGDRHDCAAGGHRLSALRMRAIVSSIGARVDTSSPKRRAISLTRAAFSGNPPASIALIRALA